MPKVTAFSSPFPDMMLPIDRDVVKRPEGDKEGHVPDMGAVLEGYPGKRRPQSRRGEENPPKDYSGSAH